MEDIVTILGILLVVFAAIAGAIEKGLKKAGKEAAARKMEEPRPSFTPLQPVKSSVEGQMLKPVKSEIEPESSGKEKFIDKKKLIIYSEILNRKYC